ARAGSRASSSRGPPARIEATAKPPAASSSRASTNVRNERVRDLARAITRQADSRAFVPKACRRTLIQRHRHGLQLGIGLDPGLAVLPPPAARFIAAKRQRRVDAARAIDADRTGPESAGELVRHGDVAGPNRGGEAVLGL